MRCRVVFVSCMGWSMCFIAFERRYGGNDVYQMMKMYVEGFFFVFRWSTFNNGANVSSVFFSFFFFIENVLRKLSSFNDENICACIMECM